MVFNTGAALLDAIVLAVVSKEPEGTYGYKITQDVRGVLDISESTLYPVLRRLQKDDCLEVYDQAYAGRNRRYYKLTEKGQAQLNLYKIEWKNYSTKISSMCTVFAESEVISLIGRGEPRENIARGVIDSVVSRVATMAGQAAGAPYYLTGGLCENAFVVERLGELLGSPVTTSPQARFAGAIGAAIRAQALD